MTQQPALGPGDNGAPGPTGQPGYPGHPDPGQPGACQPGAAQPGAVHPASVHPASGQPGSGPAGYGQPGGGPVYFPPIPATQDRYATEQTLARLGYAPAPPPAHGWPAMPVVPLMPPP